MQRQLSGTADTSATTLAYRCLLRPLRLMWQVSVIPSKIGETIGSLYKYAQDSLDNFLCSTIGKARRKERDGDQNSTDTKLYLEESVLERKLPEADLKALVDLPAGLDYNEWLASHTLALFEHVNLVYGTVSEFCTPSGCADMTGPGNRMYLWFDEKGKKTRVAAPQYIDYVMIFTQKTVSDESIFPTKYANEFPSSFESIARKILRLQFHVIAHLYAAHFREIALLGLHTHLNLTFAHLTALHRRFNLIDEKETDVLRDLELALRLTDDTTTSAAAAAAATVTATTTNTSVHNSSPNNSVASCSTTNNCNNSNGFSQVNNTKNPNNNNNNNSNNCNNHNYQPNTNCSNDDEITTTTTTAGETTTTTFTKLNESTTTTAPPSTTTTTALSSTVTLIDGDANVPPICAQPETKANKLTINSNENSLADRNDLQLHPNQHQHQHQHQFVHNNHDQQHSNKNQQHQKSLDHVHTRLIQCNVNAAPNILAMQQQQQQQ